MDASDLTRANASHGLGMLLGLAALICAVIAAAHGSYGSAAALLCLPAVAAFSFSLGVRIERHRLGGAPTAPGRRGGSLPPPSQGEKRNAKELN